MRKHYFQWQKIKVGFENSRVICDLELTKNVPQFDGFPGGPLAAGEDVAPQRSLFKQRGHFVIRHLLEELSKYTNSRAYKRCWTAQ